jgi:hypothetical protein
MVVKTAIFVSYGLINKGIGFGEASFVDTSLVVRCSTFIANTQRILMHIEDVLYRHVSPQDVF